MTRSTTIGFLLPALLALGCGYPGHVPGSQTPQPVYPGAGDFDADGTADVLDRCPRDYGPEENGGCEHVDVPEDPDSIRPRA